MDVTDISDKDALSLKAISNLIGKSMRIAISDSRWLDSNGNPIETPQPIGKMRFQQLDTSQPGLKSYTLPIYPDPDYRLTQLEDGWYVVPKNGKHIGPYAFTEAVDKAVALGRKETS